MSFRRHNKSSSNILKEFEVLEENRLLDTFISYTVCSKTDRESRYTLTRETVEKSQETILRVDALLKSKEIGIIRASSITVEQLNTMLMVYTLYPISPSTTTLQSLLLSDSLSSTQKLKIFKNLSNTICSLQDLGVPYLELGPSNIIIESKSLVYLKPFKIVPDIYNEENYYVSPELLSGISYFTTLFAGDVWSLGCIYAELFLSLTPLFQAPSVEEKLVKMFLILGTPVFQDVEGYMSWDTYQEIKSLVIGNKDNLHKMIFNGIGNKEKDMILDMMNFNTDKRVDAKTVSSFSWHEEESGDEEVLSFFEEKSKISEKIVDRSFEPLPCSSDILTDNTLQITLKSSINLDLFRYCPEDYYLIFSFDVDLGTSVYTASTPALKAGHSVSINFSKDFQVNTQDLKKKYRTNPFIIKLSQCMISGDRRREDHLGICEAYLGLLFSPSSENIVQGWYNITSGKGILGQILIEVKLKSPLKPSLSVYKPVEYEEENTEKSLIKDITLNLGNLTAQLLDREDNKQKKELEDIQFAETLKKLRKLLLDNP